jgi:two-component system OmpR family response regulator
MVLGQIDRGPECVAVTPSLADRSCRPRDPTAQDLLLVEDDAVIAREISVELRGNGLSVHWCASAEAALKAIEWSQFSLCVVDRNLPGLDGLSLLKRMRACNPTLGVIVISALGQVEDRVAGLEAGGDDYLPKPFALVELAARVQALLRRPMSAAGTILRYGPVELDLVERTVRVDGRMVDLQPREFSLLAYFVRRPEQVITREMLLTGVWKYTYLPQTNLVDVHLGKLRRKIDTDQPPSLIQNIRGVGFMLRA